MKKGSKHSEETKRKMSKNHADFRKEKHPFYGKHHTKKAKKKMSEANSGEKSYWYGKKHTKESKKKMSKANSGKNNPNYSKHTSLETRMKMSEANSGENNPNWKGGISCEPYCQDWTKEYKKYIKERDNNECQNPDCWKNCNHLSLEVHHIDYNKKNCIPKNLLTLCKSCNSRANGNREECQQLYEEIIIEKYKVVKT